MHLCACAGVYNVVYNLGPGLAGNNLATLVDAAPDVALFRLTGGPNYGYALRSSAHNPHRPFTLSKPAKHRDPGDCRRIAAGIACV